MKRLLMALTFLAAGAAAPAFAASPQMDGTLPMYPNSHLDARESIPAGAIAKGVPLVLLTADSVSAVDGWYKSNTPKSCTRRAAAGGVQYKCPGGSIQIYDHGGTQIALLPAMPL
jgi:hypothetical protein